MSILPIALYGCDSKPSKPKQQNEKLMVTKWYKAVEIGDANTAIKLATKICGKIPNYTSLPGYINLCKDSKINPKYLKLNFNIYDFQYWEHSLFFKNLSQRIINKSKNNQHPISALFSAVHDRIKPIKPPKGTVLWPYTIWKLKKGVCDRQAWGLCELAYQLGYETQIVYLRNPKTLISPHTICEIRKENEKWVADPLSGKLLSNISIVDISTNPKLATSTWPKRTGWQEAIKNPIYFLPAYPQDYCQRNQLLQHKIQTVLKEKCPRFGQSPIDRLHKYISLTSEKDQAFNYQFWFYPFRLLYSQIRKLAQIKRVHTQKPKAIIEPTLRCNDL